MAHGGVGLSVDSRAVGLVGRRVDALWDCELAPAMAHRGLAIHEEATLPDLLTEL